MTFDELRARIAQGPERLWWSWRLLDGVLRATFRNPGDGHVEAEAATDCFLELAAVDPDWAISLVSEEGPAGHQVALLFSEGVANGLLDRIHLDNTRQQALLRAALACAVAQWGQADCQLLLTRAWSELARIPEPERDDLWNRFALTASAAVDYPAFRVLMETKLAASKKDFWRARTLPVAWSTAATHGDWTTFERWAADYRSLPPALTHGHSSCALVSLEGIRALDENRGEDARQCMQRLLELARAETFLSNDDISRLPKRLRSEARHLELCDAFDALVKARDWRGH